MRKICLKMKTSMDKTDLSVQSHWDGDDLWDAHSGLCQGGIHVSVFTAVSAKLLFSKWRRQLWSVDTLLRHSVSFCHEFWILIIIDFTSICRLSFPSIFSLPEC